MQTLTAEVKLEKKPVGTATYPVYESVEEIQANISAEDLVVLVNRQVKLQAINKVRSIAANDTPSRKISRVMKRLRNNEITKAQARELCQEILMSEDGAAA